MYVPLGLIESWYKQGTYRLVCNIMLDLVLALVAIRWLTEIDWEALEDRKWVPYN